MFPFGDSRWKREFSTTIAQGSFAPIQLVQASKRRRLIFQSPPNVAGDCKPNGFTLLELLIVLAVMGTITVLVWPSMQRRMARSQLKQLAIDLQDEFADARLSALRHGKTYEFRFASGNGIYWLGPAELLRPLSSPGSNADREYGSVFDQIEIGNKPTQPTIENQESELIFRKQMDPGVFVADEDSIRQLSGALINESSSAKTKTEFEMMEMGASAGSIEKPRIDTISITPDGRSMDREFAFCDSRLGLGIRVRIRGLTGQVEIEEFFSIPRGLEPGDDDTDTAAGNSELDSELLMMEELSP